MVTDGVIVRFGKLLRFGKEFIGRGDADVAGDILMLEDEPPIPPDMAERADVSTLALLLERYTGIPLIDVGNEELLLALLRLKLHYIKNK